MPDTAIPLVLIVDDDSHIRDLCRDILEHSAIRVDLAANGAEALEMIRHRRYGAIILDLMMPVVNGFEVLQEIKSLHPWLLKRTIVATAASEATLKTFSDSMQIAALLRKPFDIGELRSAVLQCLEAGD